MAPKAKPIRERQRHYVREWREQAFSNQAAAEEALGWSQSKVSRLESGRTPYNQDDLEHAAEVFGCRPADLLAGPPSSGAKNPEQDVRAALLAYGVDREELPAVMKAISGFVSDADEQSPQDPRHDQSEPANRRRESEPSPR